MRLAESVGLKVLDGIGDFPIELFLFPSENNYVNNPELGPSAHAARISLDLFLAEKSIDSYLDLCKSFYDVEIGRNICVILDKIIWSEIVPSHDYAIFSPTFKEYVTDLRSFNFVTGFYEGRYRSDIWHIRSADKPTN